jgi:LysR family transcriptional activator of mexEF-oprN operon
MTSPPHNKIDLQLLEHLDALISERHVTRAADRMGLGQPAMSGILAKLREIVGDPLLVRTSQGMVPTERALEVAAQVRTGLQIIRTALAGPAGFDPRVTHRQFRIMAPDSLAFTLLPRMMAFFETHAPGISVVFAPADVRLSRDLLEADQCDVVISYLPEPPEGLHATVVLHQKLCCIVRHGHPAIDGSISIDQYLAWPHLVFGAGPMPVSTIEAAVDKALRARRLERRIGARVSNILLMPSVIAATTMIATVSERTAHNFAPIAPVQVLKPPLDLPDPAVVMLWHDRTHHDPAQAWLRQVIRSNAEQV